MQWKQPPHVVVHDVRKQHQEEHETHLDEAFFEGHAEIAAANAFHGEQQNVSAIKNRNRQQIEDAQVQAENRHQVDRVDGAFLNGLASLYGDSHKTLQLLDREFSREEFADNSEQPARRIHSFDAGLFHGSHHRHGPE